MGSIIMDVVTEFIKDNQAIAFLISLLTGAYLYYLSSMEHRREKVYLDFFLVERFGRDEIKKKFSLGYITSGLSVVLIIAFFFIAKESFDCGIRLIVYGASLLGLILYCWFVYKNYKPDKYEIRRWAFENRCAQLAVFICRLAEHGIF